MKALLDAARGAQPPNNSPPAPRWGQVVYQFDSTRPRPIWLRARLATDPPDPSAVYFLAAISAWARVVWPASSHVFQFAMLAPQPASFGAYQVPSLVTIRPMAPPGRPSRSGQ